MVELIVGAMILMMILGVAVQHFRHSRQISTKVTAQLTLHMEVRKATDRLLESLFNASEIVKPLEGGTLPYLVVKDMNNFTQVVFLESPTGKKEGPFRLVSYTDKYKGSDPKEKRILVEGVKDIYFTNVSPGVVLSGFTLKDSKGEEQASMVEIPLSNFEVIDEL